MKRVGSAYWAKRCLRDNPPSDPWGGRPPTANGWQAVGRGMWRSVYKRPGGNCVYKITSADVDSEEKRWGGNELEHFNAQLFADKEYVPPTTLYRFGDRTVLAMPYYPKPYEGTEDLWDRTPFQQMIEKETGLSDVKTSNMRMTADDKPMLIDLGVITADDPSDANLSASDSSDSGPLADFY